MPRRSIVICRIIFHVIILIQPSCFHIIKTARQEDASLNKVATYRKWSKCLFLLSVIRFESLPPSSQTCSSTLSILQVIQPSLQLIPADFNSRPSMNQRFRTEPSEPGSLCYRLSNLLFWAGGTAARFTASSSTDYSVSSC